MQQSNSWSVVCHLDYTSHGSISIMRYDGKTASVKRLDRDPASGLEAARRPVFLGIAADDSAIIMDAESKVVSQRNGLPEDAFIPYAYRDPDHQRIWFMNDGDEDTGCDALNCGDQGASVTIVNNNRKAASIIKTLCVGRGHHVTVFVRPTDKAHGIPKRAFVSNLEDGTVSVIGNDDADAATYLKVLDTINLCQPDQEEGGKMTVPNGAYPHGMEFSPVTGKIYNLCNGYGSISVIDPVTNRIESTITLKKCSNLLLSPCGRFLVGKGADRKEDPEHVIGKLAVVDLHNNAVVRTLDLPDIYPSVYRFSPDGSRLYVTTAATGKGAQRDNLNKEGVLVFDATVLPELRQLKEIRIGRADCGRRPLAFTRLNGARPYVFFPNPSDGTLSIVDGKTDAVLGTVTIGEPNIEELLFSFWQDGIYGA